ncbi:DUF1217 domain-containing protein [Roseitranquillus sediminis]|uniref:DUF1217 domain-containing protein n=1 Tax=Roseitranquillus sediminis TaxID=2809051 RepID=UPI001D0C3688|nr:DUF1217 domain-containing protein [Roseitranquillus sediminis]MBM9596116.1 DUF1217 domain-containing protein [Roseitranquillus sediminis]
MSFQPVLPAGGSAGWAFLKRTRESQQTAFDNSGRIARDTDYFEKNIAKVKKPEDLMKDFRLLSVALGAFGLDSDINSKFFVRKVLSEGTLAEDALANKMSDKRYKAMAQAFGFDLNPPKTQLSDFGAKITAAYKERQFEIAVGEQDPNMRLALGLGRELDNVLKSKSSKDATWFTVMSTPPLRKVFEGAFNLPASFGMIDIDKQLETFKAKSRAAFGTDDLAKLAEPEKREELTRLFLVRADLQSMTGGMSRGSVALTLLQSAPRASIFG